MNKESLQVKFLIFVNDIHFNKILCWAQIDSCLEWHLDDNVYDYGIQFWYPPSLYDRATLARLALLFE